MACLNQPLQSGELQEQWKATLHEQNVNLAHCSSAWGVSPSPMWSASADYVDTAGQLLIVHAGFLFVVRFTPVVYLCQAMDQLKDQLVQPLRQPHQVGGGITCQQSTEMMRIAALVLPCGALDMCQRIAVHS